MSRLIPRAVPLAGRSLLAPRAAKPTHERAQKPTTAAAAACRQPWMRSLSSMPSSSSAGAGARRPAVAAAGAAAARRPATSTHWTPQWQPTTQRRTKYKTVEEAKSRYRSGAGVLFVATGGGLLWYFEHEKERMQRKRVAEAGKGVGRPKVGGAFALVDQDGQPFTDADLRGRHALVYFGFSHCPDICPEELDKMARMFDLVEAAHPGRLQPVFVTCDPARDTPAVLKAYLGEFHPRFVGLTGTYEQIKAVCKAYRVYFSTPASVPPGQDYLVDHSIYFYLMDPAGDFVEALGRQHSPEEGARLISQHIGDYR